VWSVFFVIYLINANHTAYTFKLCILAEAGSILILGAVQTTAHPYPCVQHASNSLLWHT